MNISMLLEMAADSAPERIAVTCAGRHLSYGELLAAARSRAVEIRASNADFVAYLGESSLATVVGLFAAALAGKPFAPLNYRLTPAETARLIDRLDPAYLIVEDAKAALIRVGERGALVTVSDILGGVAPPGADGVGAPDDEGDDVAVQLFTSGTTGEPKAALLRHSNLLSYILGTVEFGSADEREATLVSVPPYHIAGVSALLSSIYAMRRIVQLPQFSPDAWLDQCAGEAVTNAFVVPTMLRRIIAHIEESGSVPNLPSVRALAFGGGKMPVPVIEQAIKLFPHIDYTNAYGLTETSSTIALLSPDDHRSAFGNSDPAIARRLGSVGRPIPTVEVEIRDEAGRTLGPEEQGEVYVRGAQVAGEYRGRQLLDETGWFPTRDAGFMDADGYLFLAGRIDDVIVRGGENISPGEVEGVLRGHPAVDDVAVVGAPSVEWGETLAAAVVLRPAATAVASELQDLVRGQLRSSRVPELVRFVEALPYNEMGKLLRRNVRAMFQQ